MARFATNRGLSARLGACAVLFRAEKPEKVARIAESRGCDEETASRMYVMGALKASVRRGTSKTLEEALERFEEAQVGDRSVSVHGEASINKEVRRINAINETSGGHGASHARNMGKVLGTIYVEWDGAVEASAPEVVIECAEREAVAVQVDTTITAYLSEYVTRLSHTARKAVHDIVCSHYGIDSIMGAKDSDSAKLKERAKYLHHNFPHNEAVTTRELVQLLRQYKIA